MNKAVYMAIELALIVLYLGLIIFVIPKGSTLGVIIIGVLTLVIFGTVFFLEKKREASGEEVTAPVGETQLPPEQQQTPPATPEIQPVQPGQQPPVQ